MTAFFASLFLVLAAGVPAQTQSRTRIEEIRVTGNHRVPTDTIKYRLQSKAGDPLNPNTISRDVKALFALGYFENVRVDQQPGESGMIVVFDLVERRLIRAVKYEGLRAVTASDVGEAFRTRKIGMTPETPLDPARLQRAEATIRQLLAEKGYQEADVQARVENVEPGAALVTFAVKEGPQLKVQEITIEGNQVFSDDQLKAVMKQIKEPGFITTLTRKGAFDELRLSEDISRIRMHYASNGYVRTSVPEPIVSVKSTSATRRLPLGVPLPFLKKQVQGIHVTLKIEENEQYRVGDIAVTGNKEFTADQIRFSLGLIQGTIYNEDRMRRGLNNLRQLYGGRGYINFTAVPDYKLDEGKKIVNLMVNIEEDRKFYVNRIAFAGNLTTRDKVIRRELALHEGQIFDSRSWDLSLLKLNQLGYFDVIRPDDADMSLDSANGTVDINLKVKEREGNRIGFNGGVSGAAGGYLGLSYSTNNFLGMGETLAVNLEGGTNMSQYQVSFTEPYLFSRPLATSYSVFSNRYDYNQSGLTLNQKRSGFSLASSYPLRTFHRLGMSYQFDNSRISSVDTATQEFFGSLASGDQDVSRYLTRRVTSSYSFNTVDNPNNPGKGFSFAGSMESAGGLLGGSVNFYRPTVELKAFRPLNKGRNTLAFRLSASHVRGFSNKSVPFYERFFMGGDFDLRGFDYRSISPIAFMTRTVDGVNSDEMVRVGGDTQAILNFEYRIPLAGPITLAPFIDVGNSWVLDSKSLRRQITNAAGEVQVENVRFLSGTNSGVRMSTGVELQITMPVIHLPFRLIYGFNPGRIDRSYIGPAAGTPLSVHDPRGGFKFTIGKTF